MPNTKTLVFLALAALAIVAWVRFVIPYVNGM